MYEDSIDYYFNDVKKVTKSIKEKYGKTLTKEDEYELVKRIQEGDEKALKTLCEANLRFVIMVAKKYQNQGLAIADLISEGNYGLVKAAYRFDLEKDVKFISYAVWWIKQAIKESLNTKSREIRIPTNKVNELQKAKKEINVFISQNDRDPNPQEIDSTIEWWKFGKPTSLSTPVNEDGDELGQIIEDKGSRTSDTFDLPEGSLRERIDGIMDSAISEREKAILTKYYGLDGPKMTLEAIGNEMSPSITKERVRQLRNRAIKRIRAYTDGDLVRLKEYLEV